MFVYVMDKESRDKLLELGYELLKNNSEGTIWVFANKIEQSYCEWDIPCVVSDILTF